MRPIDRGGPRGRYAPSPTGEIHLGNASTALLAWLSVRAAGGTFVMRIEDLDSGRVRPGLAESLLTDLAWLGLDWDEGPDRGGPVGPYEQSARGDLYRRAFERLRSADRLYPCFCSRKDIAAAASAPQAPGDEIRYPGICAAIDPAEAARRIAGGARHAWRFRAGERPAPGFEDRVVGPFHDGEPPGDFVVARSDGATAYQLAVVVDDAAMGIDEVVRGNDLLASTPRQLLLFAALDLAPPSFGHVPLLLGADGARLSKRQQGITLAELRAGGLTPSEIVGRLARRLRLRPDDGPIDLADLVAGFDLANLAPVPRELTVDPTAERWTGSRGSRVVD